MHRLILIFTLCLWCASALSAPLTTGLKISDTAEPDRLAVSIDPLRYNNLIVKVRIISSADADQRSVPYTDLYPQHQFDGKYRVKIPFNQLMLRSEGHYLVVLDAYVNGNGLSEAPLHERKNIFIEVKDTGVERMGMTRFVRETQDLFADAYSAFSNHFDGQGLNDSDSSTSSSGGESECCTDVDVDIDEGPDVDIDGPGGETPGGAPPGEDLPGGGPSGGDTPDDDIPGGGGGGDTGGDWDPTEDPVFDIWDCWENGNCDDGDTDPRTDDTGDNRDTGDNTEDTGGPFDTGPIDSGPML